MTSELKTPRARKLSTREAVDLLVNFEDAYAVAQIQGPGSDADAELVALADRLLERLTGRKASADVLSELLPY